jgi:hypothetical protein
VSVATGNKPHLDCGLFELPRVEPVFDDFVAAAGCADRVLPRRSLLHGPLPTADVLILGHILRDWDLTQKRELLTKAYDALPAGGAVIVYDA